MHVLNKKPWPHSAGNSELADGHKGTSGWEQTHRWPTNSGAAPFDGHWGCKIAAGEKKGVQHTRAPGWRAAPVTERRGQDNLTRSRPTRVTKYCGTNASTLGRSRPYHSSCGRRQDRILLEIDRRLFEEEFCTKRLGGRAAVYDSGHQYRRGG